MIIVHFHHDLELNERYFVHLTQIKDNTYRVDKVERPERLNVNDPVGTVITFVDGVCFDPFPGCIDLYLEDQS